VDGRRVLGHPVEIQEVHNAFKTYDYMESWLPHNKEHLLQAHGLMMAGLVDQPGLFRKGGVGIMKGVVLFIWHHPLTAFLFW